MKLIVADIGILTLENLISVILKVENHDFASFIETWVMLETECAKLAAQRRTHQDIEDIKVAVEAYTDRVRWDQQAFDEDLMFHLTVAEASKNEVLKALILVIRPDIINQLLQLGIYNAGGSVIASSEHEIILENIIAQKPEEAATAMLTHLKKFSDFSLSLRDKQRNGTDDKNY